MAAGHTHRSSSKAWARALQAASHLMSKQAKPLPAMLDELAASYGSNLALTSEDDSVSYAELARRANQYSRWALGQGIGAGDVVCLMMRNCPDYVAIWLGITRVGGVVGLLNTGLGGDVLAQAVRTASPRHVIAGADFAAMLAAACRGLPDGPEIWTHGAEVHGAGGAEQALDCGQYADGTLLSEERREVALPATALLIYTSGTTGAPKAVRVSHYRILEWSCWFAGMMDTQANDILFNCLPMYHSTGGVVGIGALLVRGGQVVIRRRFSATGFWSDVAQQGCTLFLYIGELCRYLLAAAPDTHETEHRLRLCFGNGLRREVWDDFQQRFRIPQIVEFYAATEGNVSLYNCEGRPGAIGRVPPFLAHRFPVELVRCDPDSGQIERAPDGRCMRCAPDEVGQAIGRILADQRTGTRMFEGYTDPAATERKILRDAFAPGDVWFCTGDLMRRDDAGFFYFVDRIGDTFRWKGENVSTTQVAEIVSSCPGVTDAVVYGVEVPGHEGRAGMAAIITDAAFSPDRLHAHLAEQLPEYARVKFLRVCASLDVTGTFKPVKARLLRDGYGPAADADLLLFSDAAAGGFVPLDPALRERIGAGEIRF